jgi:phage/plasmid-like protein (TIGR03299 family)
MPQLSTHAYTGEKPWRNLAVEVKQGATVAQMMKAAKVDWEVEKRPLGYFDDGDQGDYHRFQGHHAIVRKSDGKVLDVCGDRWLPTQNRAFFDFADEFVQAGQATWDSIGSLSGGQIVFGLAKLKDATFKIAGKDNIGGYLFLGIPHVQGKSIIARITFKRDVCNNTYSIAMRLGRNGVGDVFRMNHRNEFTPVQKERAQSVLKLATDSVKSFAADAKKLHTKKLDDEEAAHMIAKTFQPDWDGSKDTLAPKMRAIMDAYKQAPGAEPGTAWGAFNAVTYFTDHMASRSDDKRIANAWLGRTSRQKEMVLQTLLAA